MRSVDSWLDRFCHKHPRLGIPNLMTIIVIGTAIVYLLNQFGGFPFSILINFNAAAIFQGQVWRLISFVFVPLGGDLFSLVLSLYFYWWIGSSLEREWGSTKFTVFYVMGVLFNIAAGLFLGYASMTYVNLSMFFAFATLFPEMRILLLFILPVKVKWLAWVDAALFAWGILSSLFALSWAGVVLPIVAILNYLLFFWSDLADMVGTKVRRAKHQNSKQTINFKAATKKAAEQRGYIHKCAVCGKTDADYPGEEFRYCSKCNGYYCYCTEHIGNHTHIE